MVSVLRYPQLGQVIVDESCITPLLALKRQAQPCRPVGVLAATPRGQATAFRRRDRAAQATSPPIGCGSATPAGRRISRSPLETIIGSSEGPRRLQRDCKKFISTDGSGWCM